MGNQDNGLFAARVAFQPRMSIGRVLWSIGVIVVSGRPYRSLVNRSNRLAKNIKARACHHTRDVLHRLWLKDAQRHRLGSCRKPEESLKVQQQTDSVSSKHNLYKREGEQLPRPGKEGSASGWQTRTRETVAGMRADPETTQSKWEQGVQNHPTTYLRTYDAHAATFNQQPIAKFTHM